MSPTAGQEVRLPLLTRFPPVPREERVGDLSGESIHLRDQVSKDAVREPPASIAQAGIQKLADSLKEDFLFVRDALKDAQRRSEAVQKCRENIHLKRSLQESLVDAKKSMKDLIDGVDCLELEQDLQDLEKERARCCNFPAFYERLIERYRVKLRYIQKAPEPSGNFEVDGKYHDRTAAVQYCESRITALSKEYNQTAGEISDRVRQIERKYEEKLAELKEEKSRRTEAVRESERYQALKEKREELQRQIDAADTAIQSGSSLLGTLLLQAEKDIISRRRLGWTLLTVVGTAIGAGISVLGGGAMMLTIPLLFGMGGYLMHNIVSPVTLPGKLDIVETLVEAQVKKLEEQQDRAFNKLRKFYVKNSRLLGQAEP